MRPVYLLLLGDVFARLYQDHDGIGEDWDPRDTTEITSKLHSGLCNGNEIHRGAGSRETLCISSVQLSTLYSNDTPQLLGCHLPQGHGSASALQRISPAGTCSRSQSRRDRFGIPLSWLTRATKQSLSPARSLGLFWSLAPRSIQRFCSLSTVHLPLCLLSL